MNLGQAAISAARTAILGTLSLLAVLGLDSCAQDAGPAASHAAILRRGNGPEPESLDLHAARSEAALTVLRDLYEGLTALDGQGLPIPAAADHYEISEDSKTYAFHLRPAARWSNGEPVVAEDFVAGWRRLVDPHTAAQYADILRPVRGTADIMAGKAPPDSLGVHAVDPLTIVVELVEPTPYFLGILAHPATFPINRHSLEENGRGYSKPGLMVSNGAFTFTRWDFGSHLVAARNTQYWNNAANHLDGVEYYSFADAATELRAFRTGQVDVTSTIPAAQMAWVKDHLGGQLRVAPQLAVYFLGFNLRRPPLGASRELRQALSMVIDRDRLAQSITGGGELPAYTLVPPATHGYAPPLPEYAGWPMAKRIERAQQLLYQAGMDRHPPSLDLSYNSGELHNRIAVAVAGMWKEALGIETMLRAEEFKVLLQDIDRGEAGVFRASWLGDYNDAYCFLQVLKSDFGINLPRYSNLKYDALLERASAASDAGERVALLQNAESMMLADQPLIPLFFYVSKHLIASRVRGWQDNPLNVDYSKNLALQVAEP